MDKNEDDSSSDQSESEHSDNSELKIRVLKRRKLEQATNQELTPFEAFKKTAKYKAILKRMGKLKDGDLDEATGIKADTKKTENENKEAERDLKRL